MAAKPRKTRTKKAKVARAGLETVAAEPAEARKVQVAGYELTVVNHPDQGRNLTLIVRTASGKAFELGVDDPDDRPGLVMQMFQTLTVWPGRSFVITVDENGRITGFSPT
jgi:hypothetical protein